MKKIEILKIRGRYQEMSMDGKNLSGGDDTVDSIRMVAEKVNEIVDKINDLEQIIYDFTGHIKP